MLNANGVSENEYLEYKGRPLVRQGDELFYGDMTDKFYIFMLIMTKKEVGDNEIPDKVMVQLCESSSKNPKEQKILNGLKEAFEFADAWLDRYNK
jgi:hypothetical protein